MNETKKNNHNTRDNIIAVSILILFFVFLVTYTKSDESEHSAKSPAYYSGYEDGKSMVESGNGMAQDWALKALSESKYNDSKNQLNYRLGYRDGFAEN